MIRALLVVLLATLGASAQTPSLASFYPAKLIKISVTSSYYSYTFDTAEDIYVSSSRVQLHVTVDSQVKIRIVNHVLYVIDEDGKIQATEFGIQGLKPPPPPPPQKK